MKLSFRLTSFLLGVCAISTINIAQAETTENLPPLKQQAVNQVKKAVQTVNNITDNIEEKIESALISEAKSEEKKDTSKVNVRVEGIKQSQLESNVTLYLQGMDKNEMDGSERHQHLVEESIQKALRAFGYYHSEISFKLLPTQSKPTLVATVDIGEPVKIAGTDIQINGAAKDDPAFQKLNERIPAVGSVLQHELYDDYKSALEKLAQQRGYFDADFPVRQLQVKPSTYQGWWAILFNSGERYRYGSIQFKNAQIRDDYLRSILKIREGDAYLFNDIAEMTNDYSSSGWFQSVIVKPTLHHDSKTVDLELLTYPKKKNSMELGIGYGTDSGVRSQIGWARPWINSRGHSLRSNLYVSSPKQTIEATYKMPLLENPLKYYYEYAVGLENEDDSDTDTKTTAASAAALRYWNNDEGWQYSAGVRGRYDHFTQAGLEEKTWLFYPTVSLSRSRMSGGAFPRRADNINITVDVGRKSLLSDVDFTRIRATAGWIKRFAPNHRLLTRAEIGYLHAREFYRIPPALRFFAGGDKSVRGYGYKKISPKDRDGKLLGASRLATATIEYQYQVINDWWWATFFDAGMADDQFKTDSIHYGSGMGLRWASPIGAIKFDIATPVRDKHHNQNIQFYIGLGTEI